MKPERLKTFVANLGVALIVLNIIVPIINIFLGEGEHPRFNPIITYLPISIMLIISGIGLLQKKKWSINLYFVSSILLMVHYLVVYPLLYLIVIFFNPFMWGALPLAMLISSIYLFKKRNIIEKLFEENNAITQTKSWNISKSKFVLAIALLNILSWVLPLSYFIYGVRNDKFPGVLVIIPLFYIAMSLIMTLIVNIVLLQAHIEKNKKNIYIIIAISIILALLYIIPIANQYLTTGRLY